MIDQREIDLSPLGPGRTSEDPPDAALWQRVSYQRRLHRRRRLLRWSTGLGVAAAITAVVVYLGRPAEPASGFAVIDVALERLRPDSASNPRVAAEMDFLVRMRADLTVDYPREAP